MARFIALLASYRESAGCDVHHASAGDDRLIVLTTLDVVDGRGAHVRVGEDTNHKIMVNVLNVPRNTFLLPMPGS